MNKNKYYVTVITVTRNRVKKLQRAMDSLAQQSYKMYKQLIVIDDCKETLDFLLKHKRDYKYNIHFESRDKDEYSGVARLAKLRNIAVGMVDTEWITLFDDDNTITQNHIESMLHCAVKQNVKVVHSWRAFFNYDETPYLGRLYPWANTKEEAKEKWMQLRKEGVFSFNSNIAKDRVDPKDSGTTIRTVDANCLMIHKSVFNKIHFCEDYSREDIIKSVGDDDKLLADMVNANIRIGCTKKSTVNYYLGGFSNSERAIFN